MNTATRHEADELALAERPTAALQPRQHGGALSAGSPVGIMMAALERGITPADLRDMLALQREWDADQARKAFNLALAAFKTEAITLIKTKAVGYESAKGEWVGYKHAELFDVVAAVGPALARHGLSFRWDVKQSKDWINVTCILKHEDGHSETCEMGGPPDTSGKKNPIQSIASTTSYLQRYTLKAITGVAEGGEADGDDDGRGGPDAGGQDYGRTKADGTNALPFYPAANFETNLPTWRAAITAGRKTADQVISTIESRATLTDEQKAQIRANA